MHWILRYCAMRFTPVEVWSSPLENVGVLIPHTNNYSYFLTRENEESDTWTVTVDVYSNLKLTQQ